jgi:galactonate dehydratase
LKITALRGFRVGTKAYVKIETNRSFVGWGEVTGLDPNVAVALAQSLFDLLDGENPTRIEHLWQKLYRSHRDMRGGPFMTHVISAIDVALWDITGKAWGVPVYRLLGGPTRDKVRVYPTPKAQKTGTGGPHPYSGDPQDIENLVRSVKQARERVGPDGCVMFDAHCAVPPAMLIQLASRIEPFEILFLEEPAVPGNIEVFKRLKQHIRIPMATGERDRTIWGMLPYLQGYPPARLRPHRRNHTDEEDFHSGRGLFRAPGSALYLLRTGRLRQPALFLQCAFPVDSRDVLGRPSNAAGGGQEKFRGRCRGLRLAPRWAGAGCRN